MRESAIQYLQNFNSGHTERHFISTSTVGIYLNLSSSWDIISEEISLYFQVNAACRAPRYMKILNHKKYCSCLQRDDSRRD